jgi:hypothetical protein
MVIVGCQKGHEFLYSDFAYHFETYSDDSPNRNMWMSNGTTKKLEMVDSELVSPSRDFCTNDFYHQTFVKYGKTTKGYDFDILIHARSQDNMHTEYRNWPTENWDCLADELQGYDIACVGSVNGADYIDGTVDLRGVPLGELCDIMASSSVLLSPSSGTAHLASLCGLPHIVWSDNNLWANGRNNKSRYTQTWNPLGTRCTVIDTEGWKPRVGTVLKELEQYL